MTQSNNAPAQSPAGAPLRGPRSSAAKAAVSRNALAHGIMSTRPVVPGVDSVEEWEVHRRGVFESFQPAGHMEEACVNRIALLHWRLNRVTRFETEEIALAQEAAEEEAFQVVLRLREESHESLHAHIICLPRDLNELRERLVMARHAFATLTSLAQIPGHQTIPDEHATATLHITADIENRPPSAIPTREPRDRWTASFLREALGSLSPKKPLGDVVQTAMRFARDTAGAIERELAHTERLASRLRRQRTLPSADVSDRVARYESHLTRQIVAYTRELQALVAARKGVVVPTAHLHVTGLPET